MKPKSLYFIKYESNGKKYGEGRWANSPEEASQSVIDCYKEDYPDMKITEVSLIHD